jgi:hypothetical protein
MTPTLIIEQVAAEGIRLTLGTDGKIKAIGDQVAVTRWLPIIRAQKPGIVAVLQAAETIVIEPAAENPRPVYWERADLSIVGPGRPEFLAKVGTGAMERFWVIVEFQGQPAWVSSDRLRSRKAFEQQPEVRVVEPIPKDGF